MWSFIYLVVGGLTAGLYLSAGDEDMGNDPWMLLAMFVFGWPIFLPIYLVALAKDKYLERQTKQKELRVGDETRSS